MFSDQFRRYLGIGVNPFFVFVSLELNLPRSQHSFPHAGRTFYFRAPSQLLVFHCRHLNLNINPVEQRPGHLSSPKAIGRSKAELPCGYPRAQDLR